MDNKPLNLNKYPKPIDLSTETLARQCHTRDQFLLVFANIYSRMFMQSDFNDEAFLEVVNDVQAEVSAAREWEYQTVREIAEIIEIATRSKFIES